MKDEYEGFYEDGFAHRGDSDGSSQIFMGALLDNIRLCFEHLVQLGPHCIATYVLSNILRQ